MLCRFCVTGREKVHPSRPSARCSAGKQPQPIAKQAWKSWTLTIKCSSSWECPRLLHLDIKTFSTNAMTPKQHVASRSSGRKGCFWGLMHPQGLETLHRQINRLGNACFLLTHAARCQWLYCCEGTCAAFKMHFSSFTSWSLWLSVGFIARVLLFVWKTHKWLNSWWSVVISYHSNDFEKYASIDGNESSGSYITMFRLTVDKNTVLKKL